MSYAAIIATAVSLAGSVGSSMINSGGGGGGGMSKSGSEAMQNLSLDSSAQANYWINDLGKLRGYNNKELFPMMQELMKSMGDRAQTVEDKSTAATGSMYPWASGVIKDVDKQYKTGSIPPEMEALLQNILSKTVDMGQGRINESVKYGMGDEIARMGKGGMLSSTAMDAAMRGISDPASMALSELIGGATNRYSQDRLQLPFQIGAARTGGAQAGMDLAKIMDIITGSAAQQKFNSQNIPIDQFNSMTAMLNNALLGGGGPGGGMMGGGAPGEQGLNPLQTFMGEGGGEMVTNLIMSMFGGGGTTGSVPANTMSPSSGYGTLGGYGNTNKYPIGGGVSKPSSGMTFPYSNTVTKELTTAQPYQNQNKLNQYKLPFSSTYM